MSIIDLYTVPLALPADRLDELYDHLSPSERLRASRFRGARLRDRYVACRGGLREILAAHLHTLPGPIEFTHNRYGKPAVPGYGLSFNVSHSHEFALIAVTEGREVGVDIERLDPRFVTEQIPERFFSPGEVAELRALPQHLQTRGFFNCWTRKEAYIKALGYGLSMALDSFDVSLDPAKPAAILRGVPNWQLQALDLGPELNTDYAAAIVAQGANWQVRHHSVCSTPNFATTAAS